MFAGHVGAAMALGRAERRVNVGVLIAAAMLLDFVLWVFVLVGWESATIPRDFAVAHQADFEFPYSHGLMGALVWSAIAAGAGVVAYSRLKTARWRAGALIGAAVFSHWLLDALVHRPELPLLGTSSTKVGLGLWQDMPVALVVEGVILAAGLWLFVPNSALSKGKSIALTVFALLILAFTVIGMTMASPPPSVTAMAATSVGMLIGVFALVWWLGRLPKQGLR